MPEASTMPGGRTTCATAIDADQLGPALSSTTVNTKGVYTELVASTAHAATSISLFIYVKGTTTSECALVDIAVGAAASEVIVASNLPAGTNSYTNNALMHAWMDLPIAIPAGTRIAARMQMNTATQTNAVKIAVFLHQKGPMAGQLPTRPIEGYGALTAGSTGTAVDPGATINTKGAWTSIGSTTTRRHTKLWMWTGKVATTGANFDHAYTWDIALTNAGGSPVALDWAQFNNYDGQNISGVLGPIPCDIPAGSQLWARCQSSNNEATRRQTYIVLVGA